MNPRYINVLFLLMALTLLGVVLLLFGVDLSAD